jgi:hypothetical protein
MKNNVHDHKPTAEPGKGVWHHALRSWYGRAGIGLALAGLVVAGWYVMSPWWSNHAEAQPGEPKQTEFAADRAPGAKEVPFDGEKAMGHLKAICDLGPRISGSEAMAKQQDLITKHFEALGAKVARQEFTARQLSIRRETKMANLVVSWDPDNPKRVILCTHYDTRPQADMEPDPRRRKETFLGANDGGSGAALLMELGRHMKDIKCTHGVDFVFFDGEEWVFERGDIYFFGSNHFAREHGKQRGKIQYRCAVLLDMIAGKQAVFPVEQNSWFQAPRLVEEVWNVARQQDCKRFRRNEWSRVPVEDDHMPLNQGGIPAIDIIDFDYPHWHLLSDTPANCSGETMAEVAKVLVAWLQQIPAPK